jgi:hypothetical protein
MATTVIPSESDKLELLALMGALPISDTRWAVIQELFQAKPPEDAIWERQKPIVEARLANHAHIQTTPLGKFISSVESYIDNGLAG